LTDRLIAKAGVLGLSEGLNGRDDLRHRTMIPHLSRSFDVPARVCELVVGFK
jgi:hypothetical protein